VTLVSEPCWGSRMAVVGSKCSRDKQEQGLPLSRGMLIDSQYHCQQLPSQQLYTQPKPCRVIPASMAIETGFKCRNIHMLRRGRGDKRGRWEVGIDEENLSWAFRIVHFAEVVSIIDATDITDYKGNLRGFTVHSTIHDASLGSLMATTQHIPKTEYFHGID